MNHLDLLSDNKVINIDPELTFHPDRRIIDLTYGEFIMGLRKDVVAELLTKVQAVPALEEGKVHPETGLPEAPEDEVNSYRDREILRSKVQPISVPTLDKYRKKPEFDITGRNIGGFGLPFKLIGRRAMYKVKDLLIFRNNHKAYINDIKFK